MDTKCGGYLDSSLSMEALPAWHPVVNSYYCHLQFIQNIRLILASMALFKGMCAFVIFSLDYWNRCLTGLPLKLIHGAQQLQNTAVCLFVGLQQGSSLYLCNLHSFPVCQKDVIYCICLGKWHSMVLGGARIADSSHNSSRFPLHVTFILGLYEGSGVWPNTIKAAQTMGNYATISINCSDLNYL